MKHYYLRALFFIMTFFVMVSIAEAGQKTFTGPGNFSDASKWNGNSLPSAGDDIRIKGTCTFDNAASNLQYGILSIGQGPSLGTLQWPVGGTNTLRVTSILANTVACTINMTNGGTLQFTGTWTTTNLAFVPGAGTIIAATTAGVPAITMPAAYSTYNNLSTSGTGTVTLGTATTLTGNLSIGAAGTLNTGGQTLAVNGNVSIGLLSNFTANASSITVKGNWSSSGTFNAGTSTVTFNGSGAQSVSSVLGSNTFYNLATANTGTGVTFNNNTVVNNAFTNTSGIANIGAINFTVTGATTVGGTVNFTSTTGIKTFNNITVTGTWNAIAAEAFTINGSIVNNGTITANSGVYTLAGAGKTLSGSNAITIPSAAVTGSYTNNGTFTVGTALSGAGSLTQGANSILNIGGTSTITTLDATANMPNMVVYNGAGAQFIKCTPYSNLTISGSSIKALACASTVNGDLLISSGTLDASASNFNINLLGNWTNTGGTFNPRNATVSLTGSATQTITKAAGETFYNLIVAGTGALLGGPITTNNDLTITSTLDASTSNYQVNVKRNWVNNGTFTQQLGTVNLNGTVAQSIGGSASTTFYNLTLNNSAGASIALAQNLRGTLTLTSGTFNTSGQVFTIISDATSTGRIGTITGGNITGNVTMQRYLPSGPTGWRMLGCPLAGRTLSDWSDDFIMSGFTGSQYPTFSFNSVYTYDETQPDVKDTGFVKATNITNPLTPGKGFFIWLGPVPLTIDVTGTPNKFTQSFSLTYTNNNTAINIGWNLVSNPYPSSIDWNAAGWTKTNLNNAIYVWNPSLQQFASYVGGFGTNGGSNIIPSSQAFWVQANAASPALSLTETAKSATDQAFFKVLSAQSGQYAFKLKVTGNNYSDETVIGFDPAATTAFDASMDAQKMASWNAAVPSISSVPDTIDYSVNNLPPLTSDIAIPVRVMVGASGTYIISDSLLGLPYSSCLVLEDLLTGAMTDLRTASYSFYIADTTVAPRFLIHVGAPIIKSSVSSSCSNTNDGIGIATGTGSGPWNYTWQDANGMTMQSHSSVAGADSLINVLPGVYTVSISNNSGLCTTLSDTVVITSPAPLTFSATAYDETCSGNADGYVMLNAVNGGTAPFTYSWSNGMTTGNAGNLGAGTYTLTVTDAHGCARVDSVTIAPGVNVVSSFTSNTDTTYIVYGGNVTFTNTSSGAASYEWSYGDNSTDTLTSALHAYTATGTYSVMLVAFNGSCADTSYSQVVVLYDPLSVNELSAGMNVQLLTGAGELLLAFDLDKAEDVRVTLYNALGQQLDTRQYDHVQHDRIPLHVSSSKGIYFVRIDTGDRSVTRKFFRN